MTQATQTEVTPKKKDLVTRNKVCQFELNLLKYNSDSDDGNTSMADSLFADSQTEENISEDDSVGITLENKYLKRFILKEKRKIRNALNINKPLDKLLKMELD